MAGFNRVIIMGNLTRDPDYKQLNSGQAVCRLGLAANRQYRNKQTGDMVQEVCFVDVDVWGPQAESCRQYLAKGRPVLVEGRLKLDTWQDNDGKNRSKHSIVADRVVFMSSASAAESVDTNLQETRMQSQDDLLERVKTLAAQNAPEVDSFTGAHKEPVKEKSKKKKAETSSTTGEVDIVDEPPFQELPF